jgi:hypothetical protein
MGHEGRIGKSAIAAAKGLKLCEELLMLRIKYAEAFSQMDAIKASLIELATDAGEGFRENVCRSRAGHRLRCQGQGV